MGTTVTILPAQQSWDTLKDLRGGGTNRNQIYRSGKAGLTTREWWEDGGCQDKDPNLFEIQDGQSKQEQHEAIAEGLAICTGCPVKDACLKQASAADKYWTTRGGVPPERLFVGETRGTPMQRGATAIPQKPVQRGVKCKRGHDSWMWKATDATYSCRECRNMRSRAYHHNATLSP